MNGCNRRMTFFPQHDLGETDDCGRLRRSSTLEFPARLYEMRSSPIAVAQVTILAIHG